MSRIFTYSMSYFFSSCSCFSCNLLSKCEECDVTPFPCPLYSHHGTLRGRNEHICPLNVQ